jgi:hypothetical protein
VGGVAGCSESSTNFAIGQQFGCYQPTFLALIVGLDCRFLAVGASKWDAKASGTRNEKIYTLPKIDLPPNLYDNFIVEYVQYFIKIKTD